MSVAHKWSPIEELPAAATSSDGELSALIEVWKDQGGALAAPGAVSKFSERLNREWAIETGYIERVYAIDRGTTETLIAKGIEKGIEDLRKRPDASGRTPEEIAAILQDHLDALEGMFALVKGERELTVGYIKELHGVLFRHIETYWARDQFGAEFEVPLEKGVYKMRPNSPTRPDGAIHEYCPPEHVAAEMERLIELHQKHVQQNLPPEVQAAWLHHAFTQIHPFADGNGRVARTLASLVFVKARGFPLIIRRDDETRGIDDNTQYIRTLEQADRGSLRPLIDLFVRAERRVVIQALQAVPRAAFVAEEKDPRSPEEVIAGIRELLVSRGDEQVIPKGWEAAAPLREAIFNQAHQRLAQVARTLVDEITRFKPEFRFSVLTHADTRNIDDAMRSVRTVADTLGYDLTSQAKSDVRELRLEPGPYRVIFAMHGAGKSYRGVVAGLLVFVGSDGNAVSATDDIFQFNYKDKPATATARFGKWFEAGLTRALEMWRAQI